MTRRKDFQKKPNRKQRLCSFVSNSAWCDLITRGDVLKLPNTCPKYKCNCQKQNTFTPRQFQLESDGFQKKYESFSR